MFYLYTLTRLCRVSVWKGSCAKTNRHVSPSYLMLHFTYLNTQFEMISVHKSCCCYTASILFLLKIFQCPSVKMEMFVWLEVMTYQVEWKFALIEHGELFVMIVGGSRKLEWCADNLDYPQSVSISTT